MEKVFYPAIVERGEADGYGVFFPDLPGCVSAGATLQQAARNAEEALALHIEGMQEDGEYPPAPSEIDDLVVDPEVREAARILVGVTPSAEPPPAVRVNVTLPARDLHRIDSYVAAHGMTRSGFLVEAARRALERGNAGVGGR